MPIKSMTGFGRAEASVAGKPCILEVRSVNGRFLEISVKLPKTLTHLEFAIRQRIRSSISRGSVSVHVNWEDSGQTSNPPINRDQIQRYLHAAETLRREFGVTGQVELQHLLALPDLFAPDNHGESSAAEQEIFQALDMALGMLNRMRAEEGSVLAEDLRTRIRRAEQTLDTIAELAPQRIPQWKAKLEQRIRELLNGSDIDPMRITLEAGILADRLDISEEITRFRSHCQLFTKTLDEETNQGKKLNFILQEMTREANTLGTKCQDAEIARLAILLKDEIESMREQVQNIE